MTRLLVLLSLVVDPLTVLASSQHQWTRQKVADLHFYVRDPVRVESYSCTRQGFVAAELGTRGGGVAGPLLHWRIRKGRLQITDQSSILQEFTLLSMQRGLLTVRRRSGEIVQFLYQYEREKT